MLFLLLPQVPRSLTIQKIYTPFHFNRTDLFVNGSAPEKKQDGVRAMFQTFFGTFVSCSTQSDGFLWVSMGRSCGMKCIIAIT